MWPPPLPSVTDPAEAAIPQGKVDDPASLGELVAEEDPSMADAPGTPAMDEARPGG